MTKKFTKLRLTTKYSIVFGLLMFLANITLGIVMMYQSTSTIQSLVRKNMLSISNTAAALIDGDEIGALTEKDVGKPVFLKILHSLAAFQNNVDIEYIYAVREKSEGVYVFTVDADPEDPAAFGEEVLVTDALVSAADGVAAVDTAPAQDEWGNFYSAYSPIFDSKGKVAGVVGVDFNSEWYDRQMRDHTLSITIVTVLAIFVAGLIILYFAGTVRKQFDMLSSELTAMSEDVDELAAELRADPRYEDMGAGAAAEEGADEPEAGKGTGGEREARPVICKDTAAAGRNGVDGEVAGKDADVSDGKDEGSPAADKSMKAANRKGEDRPGQAAKSAAPEIEEISRKIRSLHAEIRGYLDYMHSKTYVDALTHVGNATAYLELQKELELPIREGVAAFSVGVFDVNYLKKINDQYGHIYGNRVICGAAEVLAELFGIENTFRIGGDEFAVVAAGMSEKEITGRFPLLVSRIATFNRQHSGEPGELSLSMGAAEFERGKDENFQSVFARADARMYQYKVENHKNRG